MNIIKSFFIAFAMYSEIPVPQFNWEEENMKYVFCFFPWVGAVIGLTEFIWFKVCSYLSIGDIAFVLFGTVIPFIITGGFHADGFMDVSDALCSYQNRERKLEILKDSRVGAFAVIKLLVYCIIYMASFSEIRDKKSVLTLAVGFIISRCLSGMLALWCKSAAEKSSLKKVRDASLKITVTAVLAVYLLICLAAVIYLDVFKACIIFILLVLTVFAYRHKAYKEFGGVTGDTAGYFLMICELVIVVSTAICEVIS